MILADSAHFVDYDENSNDKKRHKSGGTESMAPIINDNTYSTSSLKPIAFAAVVFSTVAVTACLLTFPMVFHYVQTLQATVQVSYF